MATLVAMGESALEDEFEAFYRARYVSLVRLGFLLLGSRHEAEEVVQEAFVALHRRWHAVEQPAAYVRVSVVNGCRSRQRRAARERASGGSWGDSSSSGGAEGLGADELLDTIARLPERQRAVIVLRYYEDMTEADIAAALGCRPGSVKSLASRALDNLRKVVER